MGSNVWTWDWERARCMMCGGHAALRLYTERAHSYLRNNFALGPSIQAGRLIQCPSMQGALHAWHWQHGRDHFHMLSALLRKECIRQFTNSKQRPTQKSKMQTY